MYFLNLLHTVFNCLTDTLHKTGFKAHCAILSNLVRACITISENGRTISPEQPQGVDAVAFLKDHLLSQLSQFPNLTSQQVWRRVTHAHTHTPLSHANSSDAPLRRRDL